MTASIDSIRERGTQRLCADSLIRKGDVWIRSQELLRVLHADPATHGALDQLLAKLGGERIEDVVNRLHLFLLDGCFSIAGHRVSIFAGEAAAPQA